jgi:hypothetical protein
VNRSAQNTATTLLGVLVEGMVPPREELTAPSMPSQPLEVMLIIAPVMISVPQ